MDFIASDKILQMRPDTIKSVRMMYNLDDPRKLDEAIDILHEWVQKQPHFNKKDFSKFLTFVDVKYILLKISRADFDVLYS